jgi:V8-like Glu-specific endopeptidase
VQTKTGYTHFCTAAVVNSPQEDLAITAAHCVQGRDLGPHGDIYFAPGYYDGHDPHGRWVVAAAIVDSRWKKNRNPNDDVAFLVIGRGEYKVQKITGGETVVTDTTLPHVVRVIGYPDHSSLPIACDGTATPMDTGWYRQMVFDCSGYTAGTSGGPFLIRVSKKTGEGDVIGVIGGYELGGKLASVSYAAQFLNNVASLYKQAVSG